MKFSAVLIGLFLFATGAQAQHTHSSLTSGGTTSGYGHTAGGWGSGPGWSNSNGAVGHPVAYEDPKTFTLLYARNDGPFVPSVYMSYEAAVRLGQEVLAAAEKAAEGEGASSLGDVARAYRTVRIPTFRLQSRVTQDNSGKLQVCNLNGNDCHRP